MRLEEGLFFILFLLWHIWVLFSYNVFSTPTAGNCPEAPGHLRHPSEAAKTQPQPSSANRVRISLFSLLLTIKHFKDFVSWRHKLNCFVCVWSDQAPTLRPRLHPGHRTQRREDTTARRPTTADSWPTRPRRRTTIPRNTKTQNCRPQTRTWNHHCPPHRHYEQSEVITLVTAHTALPKH